MRNRVSLVGALALVAGASVGAAQAGLVTTWDFVISGTDGSSFVASANPGSWNASLLPNGSTVVQGEWQTENWYIEFDLVFDLDPQVTSNYILTNQSGGTLGFIITASLGVTDPSTNLMRGSISGSIGDNTLLGDTATCGPLGMNPLYTAMVDGGPVRTLHDPFAGVTTLPNGTEVVPTQDFGIPAFEAGPAIASSMAIRNAFTITADDSAGLNNTFILVPTPGAAAVMGVAGLVGLRRRR